ncbi:MAG: hypothetical protein Q9221_008439 [Calogaya cf. arnoldii]
MVRLKLRVSISYGHRAKDRWDSAGLAASTAHRAEKTPSSRMLLSGRPILGGLLPEELPLVIEAERRLADSMTLSGDVNDTTAKTYSDPLHPISNIPILHLNLIQEATIYQRRTIDRGSICMAHNIIQASTTTSPIAPHMALHSSTLHSHPLPNSSRKPSRLHVPNDPVAKALGHPATALDHHVRITIQKTNIAANTNTSIPKKIPEPMKRLVAFLVLRAVPS